MNTGVPKGGHKGPPPPLHTHTHTHHYCYCQEKYIVQESFYLLPCSCKSVKYTLIFTLPRSCKRANAFNLPYHAITFNGEKWHFATQIFKKSPFNTLPPFRALPPPPPPLNNPGYAIGYENINLFIGLAS